MSKSRVSNIERKTRRTAADVGEVRPQAPFQRFLGLSLSGGKSDKSCLAVLDYYPAQKRIFLSGLHEKIKSEEFISADKKILDMIEQLQEGAMSLAFDAPLNLPPCLNCPHLCGGFETCSEPEVKWMRLHDQSQTKKRPRKMFTPYTQRPIDLYLSTLENENLEVQHALGANLAPIAARAIFLRKRIRLPCLEVSAKLSVWRLGQELKVTKAHLRSYRNSAGGEDARRAFLNALNEKTGVFMYLQDQRTLCENPHAFDALISAWVGFLKQKGSTEEPPPDFPKTAAWVDFPVRKTL